MSVAPWDAGSQARDGGVWTVRDGGQVTISDAGSVLLEDGGLDPDAGSIVMETGDAGIICPPACTCRIHFDSPSASGVFVGWLDLPCCSSLCVGSAPQAWICDASGVVTVVPRSRVCR